MMDESDMNLLYKINKTRKAGTQLLDMTKSKMENSKIIVNDDNVFKYVIKHDDHVVIGEVSKRGGEVNVLKLSLSEFEVVSSLM